MQRTALVVASVRSAVVGDVVRAIDGVPGWRAELRCAVDDETWRRLRARGGVAGLVVRIRGYLMPFEPGLGRACRAADVVVATTNPFTLPAAVALRARRTPLVTLVYDVYPDSLEVGRTLARPLRAAVSAVVALGLRRAAVVVALGERVRAALIGRHRLSGSTAVIPTGIDPVRFADARPPDPALAAELSGQIVVSYVGNAGSVHDVMTLGAALRAVLSSRSDTTAILSVRGDRAHHLLDLVEDLPRCHVLPSLDDATWRWVLARTDVALVGLDHGAQLASVPSKVHAALAAGCAVLAVAPVDSDLADLVRAAEAGPVTAPGDVAAATRALHGLVADPARRLRHAAAARDAAVGDAELTTAWASVLSEISGAPTTT